MPKSKREKVVHLTSVSKRPTRAKNESLHHRIREAADEYPYVYILRINNMRNNLLKQVRQDFSDSRIFFGKTKVMIKALCGSTSNADDEYLPGMFGFAKFLRGDVGLLCSPRAPEEVLAHFEGFAPTSFARAGVKATSAFVLPAGTLCSRGGEIPESEDVPLPHSVETTLRKWGVPTRLDKGKVIIDQEYIVCKEDQMLDSNQTALLKFFGVAMSEFRVRIEAYWSATEGKVTGTEGDRMEDF
jgi:mRNA turnover protein 4